MNVKFSMKIFKMELRPKSKPREPKFQCICLSKLHLEQVFVNILLIKIF